MYPPGSGFGSGWYFCQIFRSGWPLVRCTPKIMLWVKLRSTFGHTFGQADLWSDIPPKDQGSGQVDIWSQFGSGCPFKMRSNNPMLTSNCTFCDISWLLLDGFSWDFYKRDSFDEAMEMRGNNPMLTSKLHILLNILAPCWWIFTRLL